MRMKRNVYEAWLQDKFNQNYERYKVVRNEGKRAVRWAKMQANYRWGRNWWMTSAQTKECSSGRLIIKRGRKGMEVGDECV